MAANKKNVRELTIEELKRQIQLTDQQLDTKVEEWDLPEVSACFDNTDDYLEKLELSPGQQTDVSEAKAKATLNRTQTGMKLALKYWMIKRSLEATFRALLLILLSLCKGDVAIAVCDYLSAKDSTSHPQDMNPKLSSYRSYLQGRYRAMTSSTITQWPPSSTNKIFKLAMIQKEKIQRGAVNDEFIKLTITGKIDDILLQKSPVELRDIFSENKNEPKLVLIEGAPGSGKSTLALHICQEWAEGKLFQEFDIVVLVRLRDPTIKDANTIEVILPCRNSAMASQIAIEILEADGKGVLWVLDGWDELPSDLQQDSIVKKFIRPGLSRESPLHKSFVIVTSRPSSSAELHPLVSSRVEVLGFTPPELVQYFTECLNGDLHAVQTLLDRIRENPVVEGSCYLPLNASIVVNCFLSDNYSLPTSNHGIFTSVVHSTLKRFSEDRLGKITPGPIGNMTSPESLPSELRTPFVQHCRLAYHGIHQNKVTFTNKDFTALSVSKKISDMGLMQTVLSIVGNGQLAYYCFLHLSIQELLAAVHISTMSPKDQISTFRKLFQKPRFSAVFQFYSGITKLRATRSVLSKIPRILCPVQTSVFDLVKEIVMSESVNYGKPKSLLLSLINCLYEADDPSLFEFVADLLKHSLNFTYTTMTPIDCLSVGYFVSVSAKPFSLNLSCCSIGDQGCKFLARGFLKRLDSNHEISHLNIFKNDIHEEGVRYICEILTRSKIFSLQLSDNAISSNGLSTLCEALSINNSLTSLSLNKCSLSLINHGAIPQLLRTNTKLQKLDLSHNLIDNSEASKIFESLSSNISLTDLSLSECSLSQVPIPSLSRPNAILQTLDLSGNAIHKELDTFCDSLSAFASLKTLDLCSCSLTISIDNGAALYRLLSNSQSLGVLNLSSNKVTSCHHIAAGLANNNSLVILRLDNCELTDNRIEELSPGLINNIGFLYIDSNASLTDYGMQTLARHLTTHCPILKYMWIPKHLKSSESQIFKKTNEERRKNMLSEINCLFL